MTMSMGELEVRVENFVSAARLEPLWRALEAKSARSFFLSWTWIGAWLETCGAEPVIIAVYCRDRRVGLGLLMRGSRLQLGFRRPALFLHETGEPAKDVAMIEDNGFLAERSFEKVVTRAALRHAHRANDAQIVMGGVPDWVTDEVRGAGWCDRVISPGRAPTACWIRATAMILPS